MVYRNFNRRSADVSGVEEGRKGVLKKRKKSFGETE
jgi:hypothetical protein